MILLSRGLARLHKKLKILYFQTWQNDDLSWAAIKLLIFWTRAVPKPHVKVKPSLIPQCLWPCNLAV